MNSYRSFSGNVAGFHVKRNDFGKHMPNDEWKEKKCAHTHEVLSGINVSWSVNVSTRHRLKMNFYNNLRPRAPLTSNQPRPIDESPSSIEYWEARDSGYNFLNTFTIHR